MPADPHLRRTPLDGFAVQACADGRRAELRGVEVCWDDTWRSDFIGVLAAGYRGLCGSGR
jgi:hypothetical protein